MIFKVKWGDMVHDFSKKVMISNPGEDTPIKFYYEDDVIIPFIKTQGVVMCSVIDKMQMENIDSFKMENGFPDAMELIENPLMKKIESIMRY